MRLIETAEYYRLLENSRALQQIRTERAPFYFILFAFVVLLAVTLAITIHENLKEESERKCIAIINRSLHRDLDAKDEEIKALKQQLAQMGPKRKGEYALLQMRIQGTSPRSTIPWRRTRSPKVSVWRRGEIRHRMLHVQALPAGNPKARRGG